MTRIKKLTLLFVGLVLVSAVLSFQGGRDYRSDKIIGKLFALPESSVIKQMIIEYKGNEISLASDGEGWVLNEKYKVDPSLVELVYTILGQVEVQREVSQFNFSDIKRDILSSGRKIKITLDDGSSRSFYSGGDPSKTMAYFGNENLTEIFIVAIPGYSSYPSGIFELTPGQWRDRMLFASTWRTLQRFEINYFEEAREALLISFDGNFMAVKGVSVLDTAVLMAYLAPLQYFQLNDYLEKGAFPRYDSLSKTTPFAQIVIEDIKQSNNRIISVYPKIHGESFYLITDIDNEMIVVDDRRMEKLLSSSSEFRSEL